MINKILLRLCIWLVYREVVMHQHFQKFIELRIRTDVAEHDLRNIFFSFSCHMACADCSTHHSTLFFE